MQVAIDRQASGLKPHLSLVSLFEALLDPIAFSGSLLAVAGLHGVAGDPAYVVLAVTVFLLPPDLKTLVQRLRGRGERPENVAVRLRTARSEIKVASTFDYLVINDKLPEAVREVAAIAELETRKIGRNLDKVRAFGSQLARSNKF